MESISLWFARRPHHLLHHGKRIACRTLRSRGMRKFGIPILLAFSAGCAFADVNLFSLSNITIDPAFTTPALAPYLGFPLGFPIENIFGAQIATPETGNYDTIFAGSSYDPTGNVYYDNVFFHLNDPGPNQINRLVVTGAQDGPSNPFRSFTYFDLISYTFTNISDPNTYSYTLLYHGVPTVTNGYEVIDANVDLTNVGPYFVYQFGSPDSAGPRIFGVTTVPEPFAFLAFLPFAVLIACALRRRPTYRRGSDPKSQSVPVVLPRSV